MKKILVLVMYCNDSFFIKQEKLIRDTWAKPILEGKYPNVLYFAYTASIDGKYHIDYKSHTIKIPCNDDLYGTAEKTIKTYKLIKKLGLEFDYVVRTNTSTYLNLSLLLKLLDVTYNEDIIYTTSLLSKNYCAGPYNWCLIPNGKCIVLPKKYIDIISNNDNILASFNDKIEIDFEECLKFGLNGPLLYMNFKFFKYTVDDYLIGTLINSYLINLKKDLTKNYNVIGENDFFFIDKKDYSNYITLVFKDRYMSEDHLCDRNNEFLYIYDIHENISENKDNMYEVLSSIRENIIFKLNDLFSYRYITEVDVQIMKKNNDPYLNVLFGKYFYTMQEFRDWAKKNTKIPYID